MDENEGYDRVRKIPELRECLGCVLLDITETDKDERDSGESDRIYLHFSNGTILSFPAQGGFSIDTL